MKKIVYRENYEDPVIDHDEVLVRVHFCGICGTDVSNFKHKIYQVPLIMGHEFSGEVIETGTNITEAKIGDRVCGINVSLDVSSRQLGGLGIFENGGFAELCKVPQKYLFHIPSGTSFQEATMIESFANAQRGIRLSNIGKNEKIMIIGAGNIGLCFLKSLLMEKNPEYIAIIEPNEFLRQKAMEMGAVESLPPSKPKIRKFMKKQGAPSFIFDCAGNDKSLPMAFDLIKRGGTILLEGVYKGTISFPLFLINNKEICLKGCLGHDQMDILGAISLFEHGKVNVNELISEIVPLKDVQNTFQRYLEPRTRKFIKIILQM